MPTYLVYFEPTRLGRMYDDGKNASQCGLCHTTSYFHLLGEIQFRARNWQGKYLSSVIDIG
ncbi:MAG: hypothetical protein HWN67_04170 [Candidatus Helarchaeota archaeon]|nr:hypothetical protein [Candidatus Helarchaeota archaeon]